MSPVSTAAAPQAHVTRIQRVAAARGAEAWLVEENTVPVVAVEVAFRGGSAQDPADLPGVVGLMAALLDEGAGDLRAETFQETLEEKAIELSFSSNRDGVTASLRTLPENLDEAFGLLALALSRPRFDEDAVERMRRQLSAQLRRDALDPEDLAGRTFFAEAFPGHPYGRPPRGTVESLAAISREDLFGAHRRLLTRDNIVIGAVGAISPERLSGLLDRLLADLPETASLTSVPTVAPSAVGRTEIVTLDVPQTSIVFGRGGPLRTDDDFIPAYVANHILGGGSFSSRLFTEVREKRGLAYSVYSYLSPYDHSGLILGGVATRNDRAGQSIDLIRAEILRMATEGPTPKELDGARKYLIGSYALRFDTSTKIANQLVHLQLDELGIDYVARRNDLVAAVTEDDVRAAARKLFGDGELLVVAVGQPTGLPGARVRPAPGSAESHAPAIVTARG